MDENVTARHTFVESEEDLCKLRGSKYVQSIMGDTYIKARHVLHQGRHVLFSGTPCQVAGHPLGDIDWQAVEAALDAKREEAMAFILNSI